MPQSIEVPDFGTVEFPDGMSDDDIVAAIKNNQPSKQTAFTPEPAAPFDPLSPAPLSSEQVSSLLSNPPARFQPGDWTNPGTREERLAEVPAIYGAALSAPGAIIDAVLPKAFSDVAFKPLVNPQISPEDEAFRLRHPVIGGLEAATVDLAKTFTSPIGIATLGMGVLPKTVQRVVSLAFAGQMASQFPGLAGQISDTWKLPDSPERTKKLVELFAQAAGTGVFTALATKHGLSPAETIKPTEIPNAIRQLTAVQERATLPNGKPNTNENELQTGAQAQSEINREAATDDVVAIQERNSKSANDWLDAVSRNDTEASANAEAELLGTAMGKQELQRLKVLVGADVERPEVRASGGYGKSVREAAAQERARSSQEPKQSRQPTGESSIGQQLGTSETSREASKEKGINRAVPIQKSTESVLRDQGIREQSGLPGVVEENRPEIIAEEAPVQAEPRSATGAEPVVAPALAEPSPVKPIESGSYVEWVDSRGQTQRGWVAGVFDAQSSPGVSQGGYKYANITMDTEPRGAATQVPLESLKSIPEPVPEPPPAAAATSQAVTEPTVESKAAILEDKGVPPASIKQSEPISESSPPDSKIDPSAEFAPPQSETPPPAGDVGPGLGAAKLGEVSVQGNPDIYGVAERVREERAKAGQVEPVPPGKGIAPADSVQHGRELLRSGVSAERVLSEFERTKQLSSDDMAVVRAHGEDLAERARRMEEQHGTDSEEYKTARDFLTEWDKRSKAMQTEWAKTGQAQQGETDIDTGSFTGLARAFKDQTGKDFTPKQERVAKKKAAAKKKADADAAEAKTNLFNNLDDAGDMAAAERRAYKAVQESLSWNAIRVANAETKTRIARTVAERELAKVQEEAARKALKKAQADVDKAAIKLADAENKARIKAATRKTEDVQIKANQNALDAINKSSSDSAVRLAKAENKKRIAQTVLEKKTAQIEINREKKILKMNQREAAKAATRLAKEETKLRIARADKSQFLWEKARAYIDEGMENFDDIRHRLAVDTGMSVDEVTAALGKTKQAKRLTNDLWKKQQIARRLGQQAKQWLRDVTLPTYRKAIESVPKILFGLKVGFHGTVALGTHAPAVVFQPRFWKTYIRDFGKMYAMVANPAYYERQISDLVRSKNYITARRAGLVNDPVQFEDYNSPDVSKYLGNLTNMGNRGYSILKILRQDMFDQHWDNLPRSLRQPEFAKVIADGVNHATGVVQVSAPKGANIALFAPRLEMSRVSWLLVDPAIAMKTAIEWKTATRSEKYFAIQQMKEKAWVAGTLYGLLAINQGMLSATDSKQKVNGIPEFAGGAGFDPMRGDFMKFKVAGMQLSYGNAMLTMARLPVRLYQIRTSDGGKLKNLVHPDENTYTVLGEYARSQLSPFASLVSSLWFKADWQNRPLPNSNRKVPKRLAAEGVKPYTWPEFWSEQVLPIPFEEAAREVWHTSLGMSDAQIAQMRKAMATIAIMGATGARLNDDWSLKEKHGTFTP